MAWNLPQPGRSCGLRPGGRRRRRGGHRHARGAAAATVGAITAQLGGIAPTEAAAIDLRHGRLHQEDGRPARWPREESVFVHPSGGDLPFV
jgi:hypothetical protein